MSMKNSGRPRRAGTSSARRTWSAELVDETTTSISARCAGTSESAIAEPPKRSASCRPVSSVRFATYAIRAPRDARLPAASSPIRPAPIEHHPPPVEVAEHLRRQRRGGRADRRRALADRGLRPHALADRQRLAEHPVEQRPRRHRLVRGADLAEDLPLPGNERVEAGGDPEQMQRRRLVAQAVEHAVERDAGELLEHRHDALVVAVREVQLGPVAGRETHGVACLAGQRGRGGDVERHALAQRDRRDVVRQADEREPHAKWLRARASRATATSAKPPSAR